MAVDHTLAARLFAAALGLTAGALAVAMLASGRSIDRWGRPITKSDNPIRFALGLVAAIAVAVLGLSMAAGLVHPA
jgi:hypothetical protein